MEEESISNNDKNQKIFKIISDKENEYIVTFKNIESTSLLIEAQLDDENDENYFEAEFTLDEIKENKAFLSYDTIDEILEELFPLIDEDKIHFIEEEGNNIKIIFDLPLKKYQSLEFLLSEKKETRDEKIDKLYNIIIAQNKEIKDLKSNLNEVMNFLKILDEKISNIDNENKIILGKIKNEEELKSENEIEEMEEMEDMEEMEEMEEKKEYEDENDNNIEQPSSLNSALMSLYHENILEKSIVQFLTEKEQVTLSLSCKKLSFLALRILKNKLFSFNVIFGLYYGQTIDDKIINLESKYSKEELEAPLKNFEISRGSLIALELLDNIYYLRVFTNPVSEETLKEIVIIYKLFCQLLKMEDFVQIKDDKIFWEKMSKFILDNKGNKLSGFCERSILKYNFDNKNIFKLKELVKDKEESIKSSYFSTICGTTGLFAFLIKDALEYCGAIEDRKTPPCRLKNNYLYAKTLYDDMIKYINFLEGINPNKENSIIEEKKPENNNNTEIKTEASEIINT